MTCRHVLRLLSIWAVLSAMSACASDPLPEAVTPAGPRSIQPAVLPATVSASGVSRATRTLSQAVDKTRAATTYRIEFKLDTGTFDNGQATVQPFMAFNGEVKGDTNHMTYNGSAFTDMLGGGNRVEMISTENKTFLKGSRLFGFAEPDRWYYLPDSAISKPPFDVEDILRLAGSDLSAAQPIGDANVDGQLCQLWRLDFKSQAESLLDLATTPDSKEDFSVTDSAEARFTECLDGYVHAMQWNVQSHSSTNPADKGTIAVNAHLYDFNAANIVVTPPAEAIEIK
jgi:hypothetical protein